VVKWETQFWSEKKDSLFYRAPIDTTFALYRPYVRGGSWLKALRSDAPYLARHLPWYQDPNHLDEEEAYYQNQAQTTTHWTRLYKDS